MNRNSWSTRRRSGSIFFMALLLWGCSGLSIPDGVGRPLTWSELEGTDESKLQVIVTYQGQASTHAALRLVHGERGVLFWDPGGIYGVGAADHDGVASEDDITRTNDLIIEHAPNLLVYWNFALSTGDSGMEVLEWPLNRERAEGLYRSLLNGARLGENRIDFYTDATPPFCALAVSDFLQRFGGDLVHVPRQYLFPASLAEALRRQGPQRILIFLRERSILEFRNGARPLTTATDRRS